MSIPEPRPPLEKAENQAGVAVAGKQPPASFAHLPRSQVIGTMTALMLALLLSALDQTIVGTAMPRIVAELQGFEHYAWVTTAYLLFSTAMVPIVGKLSDLYGRKPFLVSGIGLFVVASALCGFSQNMLELVLFRGLQGLGGPAGRGRRRR
jgi:MFS family permease